MLAIKSKIRFTSFYDRNQTYSKIKTEMKKNHP